MSYRHLLLLAPMFFLQSCATVKPELQDSQYQQFALAFVAGERCVAQGYTAPDVIAFGNRQLGYNLNSYAYDAEKMRAALSSINANVSEQPTREQCNLIALRFAEMRQTVESNAANAQIQEQSMQDAAQYLRNTAPKTTYCNRLGTQTICNTY